MIAAGFALAEQPGADPQTAASGFLGFVVFFLLALAIWFLGRNLTARLRRMNHAHAVEEAELEQARAQAASDRSAPEAGAPDPEDGPGPVSRD